MSDPTRVIFYARTNIEPGDRRAVDLATQRAHAHLALDGRYGEGRWETAREVSDSSPYPEPGRRPGFEALLDELTTGRYDALAAASTVRLYRQPGDAYRLHEALAANGVDLVVRDGPLAAPTGALEGLRQDAVVDALRRLVDAVVDGESAELAGALAHARGVLGHG